MSKSANGLGGVRKRPDGRFEARYTGPDGKRHSIYAPTARECARRLREATASIDAGAWVQPNKMTVSQWLDEWIDSTAPALRPGTVQAYRYAARRLAPVCGAAPLSSILPAHYAKIDSQLIRDGFSPYTVAYTLLVLSCALNAAVAAHLIPRNPFSAVRHRRMKPSCEYHIIDRQQIPAFLSACDTVSDGDALKFLFYTGLRVGELRGLTWDKVDFARGEITVSAQLPTKGRALAPTKSGESRVLILVPAALEILRARRAVNSARRLAAGVRWYDAIPNLVFVGIHGAPLPSVTVNYRLGRIGESIGLPGLHAHDLRHSYAVAALRSGSDPKAVQHNLGHASAAMTLDVYAKYTTDAGHSAAARLSDYLSAAQS